MVPRITAHLLLTAAIGTAVYLIVVFGGGEFVKRTCLRLGVPRGDPASLHGAGRYIGYFERFIVLTLLLAGQYDAIAFIFAGKSIARLERQRDVEYYLVGTFASLAWAIGWGSVLKSLLARW